MLLKFLIFLSISFDIFEAVSIVSIEESSEFEDIPAKSLKDPRRRDRDLYENYIWSEEDNEDLDIKWIKNPHPSQVSVRYGNVHHCTGSILGNEWVVTSAGCLDNNLPKETLTIVAGSSSLTVFDQIFKVKEVVLHPRFVPRNLDYDIALLQTEPMLMMRGIIEPVRLINGGRSVPMDTGAEMIGWMRQNFRIPSDESEMAEFTPMPDNVCRSAWWNNTSPRMFCAMGEFSGLEGCYPDAGAPLISISNPVLFGVFSWGPSNCMVDMPHVFTNISNVEIRGFIRRHTNI